MAVKKPKKAKEKKVSKPKEMKEKESAAPIKAEAKHGIPQINDIVKEGLTAKPPLSYETILENVLKYHPESKFNKKHLSWYKSKTGLGKNKDQ